MAITNAVLAELLKDYQTPDDLSGRHDILKHLTKALIERTMQAEITHQRGYEKHDPAGTTPATVTTAPARKRSVVISANLRSTCRAIARARSIP